MRQRIPDRTGASPLPYIRITTEQMHLTPSIAGLSVDGLSPGGAAQKLGMTRQAIHKAIRKNRLTAFWITDSEGNHVATLIPPEELERYRLNRAG